MATRRTTGQVLGDRVERYRRRAGLTQDGLAERTANLGQPMNRVTIAKIEGAARPGAKPADRTRADNATLVDVLVLAAALDVPPPLLFVPLGDVELTEFGNTATHPHLFLDWISGDAPLTTQPRNRTVGDHGAWKNNAEVVWLFRGLRRRQDAVHQAEAELQWVREPLPPATVDDVLVVRMQHVVDQRLRDLDRHLEIMRKAGIESLPKMPPSWVARMAEIRLEDGVR